MSRCRVHGRAAAVPPRVVPQDEHARDRHQRTSPGSQKRASYCRLRRGACLVCGGLRGPRGPPLQGLARPGSSVRVCPVRLPREGEAKRGVSEGPRKGPKALANSSVTS